MSLTILAVVLTACGSGHGIAPVPDAALDDRPFDVGDAAAAIDTTDAPAEAALDDVEADVEGFMRPCAHVRVLPHRGLRFLPVFMPAEWPHLPLQPHLTGGTFIRAS